MPLSENDFLDNACSGDVAETFQNLDQIQDKIESFLGKHLPLCVEHLPVYADGSVKRKGEKILAANLCKRLQAFAYDEKVLFTFFNEDPDIQKKNRTNDMSIIPFVGTAYLKVGAYYYDCEDQLYIIEVKRLPAPSRVGQGDRSREYVVSDWDNRSSPTKHRTGGIERFKEGLHGGAFLRSAMVGFVQSKTPDFWLTEVNLWITDLVSNAISSHKASWGKDDFLLQVTDTSVTAGLTEFKSKHLRSNGQDHISLRHYWLMLSFCPKWFNRRQQLRKRHLQRGNKSDSQLHILRQHQ